MKTDKSVRRHRFSIFGLLVTLLSFLLVILVIVAITKSTPTKGGYKTDPSMILYDLQQGLYSDAVAAVAENRALGADETADPDYAAAYAACDYFEAYSYYYAYSGAGDAAKASYYEGLMNDAYGRMGALQYMAEDMQAAWNR